MDSAILLFLSPMRGGVSEDYTGHISGSGDLTVSGSETNDAPCKFLIHQAAANRDRISTVLCLVSEQVVGKADDGLSAFGRFCEVITGYLKDSEDPALKSLYQTRMPQFVAIPYDFDPENGNTAVPTGDRSNFIYRHIARSISRYQFRQLYIDYTGGFRDAGFLLTELSRFLRFVDIPCRQIVYSNYSEKRILSLESAYEMFPILSGISNFINTGNAVGLQRAYRTKSDPLVDALLESMTKFAQAVSVCATGEIEAIWANMDQSIQALEQYVPTSETDVTVLMLRDFLPKVRAKFKIRPGSAAPSYLPLIRWCLDNEMLQQALTLFTEKIPGICFEEGLLTETLLNRSRKNRGRKDQSRRFWIEDCHYALHGYLFNYIAADPLTVEFTWYCKALAKNIASNKRVDWAVDKTNSQEWSAGTVKGARRLVEFIKSNFDRWSLKALYPDTCIYNKTLGDYGNNLQDFVEAVAAEDIRMASHYFVHNDYRRYSAMAQLRSQSLKRCALEVLSGNTVDVSEFTRLNCRQLKEMMQHCYIIKLLRNQTNHALEEDEQDYQYFVSQGVFSSKASLYEISREALSDALGFFEMQVW